MAPNATAFLQTLDFRSFVHINSKGLHDREHEYEPAPGVFRIVVLGSSFIEGYQVGLDETFTRLLERNLADRQVEVINLGTIAYGCGQEYLALKEEGLRYKPNLVLSAFGPEGDIRNDSKALQTLIWGQGYRAWNRPYPKWDETAKQLTFSSLDYGRARADFEGRLDNLRRSEAMKPFWENMLLYDVVSRVARSWTQRMTAPKYDPNALFHAFLAEADPKAFPDSRMSSDDYLRLDQEAWTMTTHVVCAMRDLAEQYRARFAVFTVPSRLQVDSQYLSFLKSLFPGLKWEPDKTNRRLAAFAAEERIPLLEVTSAFQDCYEHGGPPLFFQGDPHWNAEGHRVAAEVVAAWLREEGLAPK